MARIAWISGSVVFNVALIYGVYVAKAIRDANGDAPPWMAVAIFDLIVMALLRWALNDRFKPK